MKPSPHWYQEPFVWLLIGIPASAVLMAAIMIPLAVMSDDGLVEEDYYRRGLEINRSMARAEHARTLSISGVATLEKGRLTVRLSGAVALADQYILHARHRTQGQVDFEVVLRKRNGVYVTDHFPLSELSDRWHLEIVTQTWRISVPVRTHDYTGDSSSSSSIL